MADALITSAELEQILQITISDAALKTTLIAIASDIIETFTNRKFLSQTYTKEYYSGDGSHYIWLKNLPVTVLTLVESWDTYNDIQLQSFTVNDDYIPYLDEGYIYMRGATVLGEKNYRVTYTAGYVIASIPADIKYICAQIAGIVYTQKGKAGINSESIGKYSVTYGKTDILINGIPLPPDISGIITYHRRRNI